MSRPNPTRRGLLTLLAGTALWCPLPAWPQADNIASDRGIGGTGARPSEEETPGGDRGIGGTGVIGTIRRFGSIVVNDLRITYPADVRVRIDGVPARAADLKVGHVVRVVARRAESGLSTRAIDVTSEVIGPIEAVARGRLTVLGQSVATTGITGRTSFAVGQRVAVSGLRRPDGSIIASLIEPQADGLARVAGPVRRGRDGTLRIGGLRIDGLEPRLVGRRALVEGETGEAGLRAASARDVSRPFPAGLARASIEAYVAQGDGSLRLGSGLSVSGRVDPTALPGAGRPAVIETGIGRDGRMSVETVRGDGPGPGGPGSAGQGPNGQGPGGQGMGGRNPGGSGPAGSGHSAPGGGAPSSRPGGEPGGFGPGRGGSSMPGGYPIDTRSAPGANSGSSGGLPSGAFGGPGPGPGGFGGPPRGGFGNPGGFGGGGPGGGGPR
ncbi:DUF5666 domain-containing protein [Methylorubrum extorquens]|uniref:DUF5666 domain-containing protein n=1 Tax=Methylorubrum extorquens (strain CM4 / NCIMB 13688) TaxID=440085 RepID=B7KRM8_METC4|nr:DUF5666 domain-containing protein [Methylorubrum extorquens]ACK85555.1 conserved hypothetical protein; putative signal peptide [Methylorubrum extorquens CM4]